MNTAIYNEYTKLYYIYDYITIPYIYTSMQWFHKIQQTVET